MKLIENIACKWWRLWSMRLNALGLAILAWIRFDPVGALGVWNMMPGPVAHILPAGLVSALGMVLFALSMAARVVHQPKLEEVASNA